jgi:predicted nucleic acid-binding protein
MKVALDSNIIIYSEGLTEDRRNELAQGLIAAIPPNLLVIPVQSVSETLYWLISRAKLPRIDATERAQFWLSNYVSQSVNVAVMTGALEIISVHGLQVFDAIILACAIEAGAQVLLSEDMQHGFRWRGVTVVNPFLAEPHPLIKDLLSNRS